MAYNGQPSSSQGPYYPAGDGKGQGKGYQEGWGQGYQQQGWNQGYQQQGWDQSHQQQGWDQGGAPQAYPGAPQGYPGQPTPESFAMAQAEHQLAAMEETQKHKEEQRKAHEVEKLAHEVRHVARAQSESLFVAKQSCAWALMNALVYGLCLTGDQWGVSTWHATSVAELTITQGLMNVEVDLTCKEHFHGDKKLCNMLRPWADHEADGATLADGSSSPGLWTNKELKEHVCKRSKEYCITAQRNYYAGYIPLFLLPIAAFGEFMSMMLLFFYWHIKPSTSMRKMSLQLGFLGVFCAAMSFTGWTCVRPWLSGFPRMFAALAEQKGAGNGVFTGFMETWRMPVGWCLACCFGALVSNLGRIMMQWNMNYHQDEWDPEGDKALLGLENESLRAAEKELAYGAA